MPKSYFVVFGCSTVRHILGKKALDAIASVRAAVEKGITCIACQQVHLVNVTTGKVLGSDDE